MRTVELQMFLNATRDALAVSGASTDAMAVVAKIFDKANSVTGTRATPCAVEMPVCEYLENAIEHARTAGGEIRCLADALIDISATLKWVLRPNGENDDDFFKARHANAVVIGADGLEERGDIRIGISLLAPETRYPDHRHPPEEIYTVLSPGEWKQGAQGNFFSPGIGGYVHNAPNIIHGMRSKELPLLAVWSLWMGDN